MAEGANREAAEKSVPNKRVRVHANLLDSVLSNRAGKGSGRAISRSAGKNDQISFFPGLPDDMALDILALVGRSDYPTLACLNTKYKSLIGSGYLYKLRRKLGIIEHWAFMCCMLEAWEGFDPERRRWMKLPRIPCDVCFMFSDKESLAVGTDLLVLGRELKGFVAWKYSLLSDEWSRNQHMQLPRCLFGSGSVGEIAIFAGGCDINGKVVANADLYNAELGTWRPLPDLSGPRKMCSGFFMDGKFYVVGGVSSPTAETYLTSGEEYEMGRGTWRKIEDMYPAQLRGNEQGGVRSPPLVAVVNNELYTADLTCNEVKRYNKENNTWRSVKNMPIRASASNGWGLAFKACGRRLLVIGGSARGSTCACASGAGDALHIYSWEPHLGDHHNWDLLAVNRAAGTFVYNCTVMGC